MERFTMRIDKTERGFGVLEFDDQHGTECSVQDSSLATDDCIWLGSNDIGLKHFTKEFGWQDIELGWSMESHYVGNNRMHLTKEQVADLIPYLQHFVEHGRLPNEILE